MKKSELLNYFNGYNATNCFVYPTVTIDSGSAGKAFEIAVKMYLKNTRGKKAITPQNKVDTTKTINGKKCRIEIKQGATELCSIDFNGNIIKSIYNSCDLVVYCFRYDHNQPVENQAILIDIDTFKNIAAKYTRLKQSTNNKNKYGGVKNGGFYDRITIKSKINETYDYPFNLYCELLDNGAVYLNELF